MALFQFLAADVEEQPEKPSLNVPARYRWNICGKMSNIFHYIVETGFDKIFLEGEDSHFHSQGYCPMM